MFFPEFARRLYGVIGGAASTSAFAKTLFESILSEEGQSITEDGKPNTFKAYFNGKTGISRIARKATAYIDRTEFEEYLCSFSDEAAATLCSRFSDCFPDATPYDIASCLSGLFVEIITDAASSSPDRGEKEKGPSEDEPEIIPAEVVDGSEPSGAAKNSITFIQNQTIIEHDESKTFNIENSTVTFNL